VYSPAVGPVSAAAAFAFSGKSGSSGFVLNFFAILKNHFTTELFG
jgi:hypothetical protein